MKSLLKTIQEKLVINKHSKVKSQNIIPQDVTEYMVFDDNGNLNNEFMKSILPIKTNRFTVDSYKIEMNGNEVDELNYLKLCIDNKPYITISKDEVIDFLQGKNMFLWSRTLTSIDWGSRPCQVIKFNAE